MKNLKRIKYRIDTGSLIGDNPKCNLNCEYCHKDFFTLPDYGKCSTTMMFADSIAMLEEVFENDERQRKIHFSGRVEPLLVKREVFEKEVKKINLMFPHIEKAMTTNGMLLCDKADMLKELGINKINVSVHSNSLRLKKYIAGIEKAVSLGLNVSLNSIVTPDNVDNIGEVIDFARNKKVNVKFFLILGLNRIDSDFLFNKTMLKLKLISFSEGVFNESNGRYEFKTKEGIMITMNTPATDRLRPDECFACKEFSKCEEGCWDSIGITNKYIKPCGVRDDNVFYFDGSTTEDLKEKLKSGGKLNSVNYKPIKIY